MTHRETFFQIVSGKRPRQPLFAPDITDWYLGQHRKRGEPSRYPPGVFISDDDPIKFDMGEGIDDKFFGMSLLDIYKKYDWGIHCHIRDWAEEYYVDGVTYSVSAGGDRKTIRYATPKGVLKRRFKLATDGSWCPVDYLLDDISQIDILFEVISATRFTLRDENIRFVTDAISDRGQADIVINRSPFAKLLHEYLGLENTAFCIFEDFGIYKEFEKIQTEKDMELIELACGTSCDIALIYDHTDAKLVPPDWYENYCIPFYKRAGELLRKSNKLISTHVDGNLKSLLPLIKGSGLDILDGCTPAPISDYEPETLAESLGEDMSVFVGVPSSLFCDGTSIDAICAYADRLLKAFEGRAIFNVGDILPVNGSIEHVIALGEYIKKYG